MERELEENVEMEKTGLDFYDFGGRKHDRFGFPSGIHRVTAGHGGEAILVIGGEKTALLDCGMAYCGLRLVKNLKEALSGKQLDYVILSHSHYDHIGALPYVKTAYPNAIVLGAAHAAKILPKSGARELMKELGEKAKEQYDPGSSVEISTDFLSIDQVIGEGDEISLGNRAFTVLETKGHTDCSLSFLLKPDSILFTSESTGILERLDYVHAPILKSYEDAIKSLEKCKKCKARRIVLPHFGLLPEEFNETYWELYEKELDSERADVAQLVKKGMSEEEIVQEFTHQHWTRAKSEEQPYEAFALNSRYIVKSLLKSL